MWTLPSLATRRVSVKPLTLSEIDPQVVPPARHRAVYHNPELPETAVDRNAYVVCVLEQLLKALRVRDTSAQEGSMSLGNLLGAPLGGLLIAWLGPPQVLLVSAVLVATVVRVRATASATDEESSPAHQGYLAELRAGLRGLRADRLLLTIAGLAAPVNALFTGLFTVLLPAYGTRVWHNSTL